MRPLGADVTWLLSLTWAGREYRFSTRPVDGYDASLVVEGYEESAELLGADVPPPSVTVSVFMPVAIAEQPAWLRSATAVLSQHTADGDTSVRLRGAVRNPSYGTINEPVSFEIEADGAVDRALWPPADAKVSADTYPSALREGTPYPWIFGKPAHAPAIVKSETGTNNVLIAAHRVPATSVVVVTVDELGDETRSAETVATESDGLGRVVSVVSATGLAGTSTVYIDWSASAGGLIPSGAMGDVVQYLLERSTVPWDRSAWISASDELNAYRVDFYIDSPQSPWEVARSTLLSLAPVSYGTTPTGVAPILWHIGATEAIAAIEHGRNAYRDGGLDEDDGHLANAWRAEYRLDQQGTATRTAVLDAATSHPLAVSRDNFGVLDGEPLDLRTVDSSATATRALLWRAAAYSFPWRTLTYATSDDVLGALQPGDVATVTDGDFGLSSAYAHVVAVQWASGAALVTVTIIHRPQR